MFLIFFSRNNYNGSYTIIYQNKVKFGLSFARRKLLIPLFVCVQQAYQFHEPAWWIKTFADIRCVSEAVSRKPQYGSLCQNVRESLP